MTDQMPRRLRRKNMYQNPFSELVLNQRKKLNLTDEWICNVMSCHPTTLRKWENGDYLPNRHDKVIKYVNLLQLDMDTFTQLYQELQLERAKEVKSHQPEPPPPQPSPLKTAMSDDEIEEMVNQADRYILFTKKQVVKLIKQVEFKHGLRSDIE